MIKVKDSEPKMSAAKRTITVTDVLIDNDGFKTADAFGELVNVADGVLEKIPDGVSTFDIKITIELPDGVEIEDIEQTQ